MPREIERKFLVSGDPTPLARVTRRIVQGFLCEQDGTAVRVRISDDEGLLAVKKLVSVTERLEFEYGIPLDHAEEMLASMCDGQVVEKVRHEVEHAGRVWEVDVFEGANEGLVVAEIEYESHDEEIELPDWAGEEVSADFRYLNTYLAEHPFSQW